MILNKYLTLIGVFILSLSTFANVTVTSGGSLNLCVGTAYATIGKITIAEGGAADFSASGSVQTYEINAPSNFEFNPGNGSVTATGADITFSALTVTATKITLYYLLNATATIDKFELTSIQIRAMNSSGPQNIVRTAGSAVQAGNNAYGGTHASVTASQANVNFNISPTSTCVGSSTINLNGNPGGGSYTGAPGITGSTFSPTTAGIFTIKYTVTDNGCVGSETSIITVNPKPSVTFFGLDNTYCSNASDDQLTGFPSGGTFSGTGIVNTSFFRASSAGVGTNKSITYTYTDANNCQSSFTDKTDVLQAPSVTITLNPDKSSYTSNEDSILIGGAQTNPGTGGVISVTGNGVATSNGVARFYPNVVVEGSSIITRTLTAPNGCIAEASKTINVSASASATINGLSNIYCKNSGKTTMTVNNAQGYYRCYYIYEGSYYFTNPMITDVNTNDGSAEFDPSLAPHTGITYYISFYSNDFLTSGSATVYIKELPVITDMNLNTTYCNDAAQVTLTATVVPSAGVGVFNGDGVNNGKFNPSGLTGTHTITYKHTDLNGCQNTFLKNIEVFDAPKNVSFSDIANKYCEKDKPVELKLNSNITPSGGKGKFSGSGIDTINGKTVFNPKLAHQYNGTENSKSYALTYSYTTAKGCVSTFTKNVELNSQPAVSLDGLGDEYCFGASEVNIVTNPTTGSNNLLTITTDLPNTVASGALSGKIFKPSSTNPGQYYLTYKHTDPNTGCTDSTIKKVIVNKLPLVKFSGLDTLYCFDIEHAEVPLIGSPSIEEGKSGEFSSTTASIAGKTFKPSSTGVGKHDIKYTFTDNKGCINSYSASTIIYGKPIPKFKQSSFCEDDIIIFSDSNSTLSSTNDAKSEINKWTWKVDNKLYNIKDLSASLKYGNHNVTYTTTTNKGCTRDVEKTIFIGPYPSISFSWEDVCNKSSTKFSNTSSIPGGESNGWQDSISWNFGDGTIRSFKSSSSTLPATFKSINHKFPSEGIYDVIFTVVSNLKCVSKDTHKVFILPSIDKFPYSADFENGESGWISSGISDTASSTWKVGIPNKNIIKTINNNVWVTNLVGTHKAKEQSYVYSPCFSLDTLNRPMISLDIWNATDPNLGGAVLQYSSDGKVWKTVGTNEKGIGLNWYDKFGIAGNPGQQSIGQYGWSGTDLAGFKNARYSLDKILNNSNSQNLRFRIAFGGTEIVSDGFAFDNIRIDERSKVLLVEQYTNNAYPITQNARFYNFINDHPDDLVGLQYHTGYSNTDALYRRNIADPGARSLFNSVAVIPFAVVNGNVGADATSSILQDTVISKSVLQDPGFKIKINPVFTSSTIKGTVNITANVAVSNPITLYVSVLERYLNNVQGQNGETNYQWVHAKFLPDAAGTGFSNAWAKNTSVTIPFDCDYSQIGIYDPNKLAIIAFVQDNITKEIYQVAYKGVGNTFDVPTSIFEPNETTSTVSLYPNPANDVTTVVLNGKLKGSYSWLIFDELGRVVDEGLLQDGTEGFTINTQNYASGFYTLRLSNSSDGVKTQKFVVVH